VGLFVKNYREYGLIYRFRGRFILNFYMLPKPFKLERNMKVIPKSIYITSFRKARRLAFFAAMLFTAFCAVFNQPRVFAESNDSEEYKVKAAFIYNFTNYIEWPERAFPDDSKYLTIGILGRNPFGNSINLLAGKTVSGRKIVIRHIYKIEEALECQILFISDSEQKNAARILRFLRGRPVLSISDQKGFCQAGGIINLITIKKRVRFDINALAAKRAGIQIGSQLLNLANDVIE
jgi:hypothetical protein